MRFRLRHPQGEVRLDDVDEDMSVSAFQALITIHSAIPPHLQELLIGFPPKPLVFPSNANVDGGLKVVGLGIRSGETIIVREMEKKKTEEEERHKKEKEGTAGAEARKAIIGTGEAGKEKQKEDRKEDRKEERNSARMSEDSVIMRVIADDNSCLFNAVSYVLNNKNVQATKEMREIVMSVIRNQPDKYNDVFLGTSRMSYLHELASPTTWGGAVELSIFSEHYQTEIHCLDIESGHMYIYGEVEKYADKVFLLYSGIHYDAVAMPPEQLPAATAAGGGGSSTRDDSFDITVFSRDDFKVEAEVHRLGLGLKLRHGFTNVHQFTLQCEDCQTPLVGTRAAQTHAAATGHKNFTEYSRPTPLPPS